MNPWFYRGAAWNHGVGAGVFTFTNGNGNANPNDSFRESNYVKKNSK